jgi:hypothetical protein
VNLNRDFHLAFDLNWPIDIDGLIDKNRLVDYDGLMIDRLIDVDWFLDNFLHLHLFYDHLWYLLLNLYVLGHLNDLFYDSLRAWDVSRHLDLHLNRSLNHHFLHCLLRGFPCRFLQGLILYL